MLINTGTLSQSDNKATDSYTITLFKPSVDLYRITSSIQSEWKSYRDSKLDNHIVPYLQANSQISEKDKIAFFIKELGEDFEWEWDKKVIHMLSKPDEYDWFILDSNNYTQALMVAYHPKKSFIQPSSTIFYVDYLATAPWNRDSVFNPALLKGLASKLLKIASDYYSSNVGYKHGFSLHSLPAAEGFYNRIGMNDLGIDDAKESLRQFEMTEKNCKIFCGHQTV